MFHSQALSTKIKDTYSDFELKMIDDCLKELMIARQETFPRGTLNEWLNSFWGLRCSANEVCQRIKAVKIFAKSYRLTFADFMNADITESEDIVHSYSDEIKRVKYMMVFICSKCDRAITTRVFDVLHNWKNYAECPNYDNPLHPCQSVLPLEKARESARVCSHDLQEFEF